MRGDRPKRLRPSRPWKLATPHARGSTAKRRFFCGQGVGYPACAGIDLGKMMEAMGPSRLPRMRGDRPLIAILFPAPFPATPHARGSTYAEIHAPNDPGGYPACAGIDPQIGVVDRMTLRLPRMRGDRPNPIRQQYRLQLATPHARGSTPCIRRSIQG